MEKIKLGASVPNEEIDKVLLDIQEVKVNLHYLTVEMSKPSSEKESIEWKGNLKRWDLASTGCVANMTPIWGYLWLMVKVIFLLMIRF